MPLPGFKGTTYEVLTGDGARWIIAQTFRVEKEARGLANNLLASGEHALIRITARRDGWTTEKVIFEAAGEVSSRAIKPYPIAEAPFCETADDCLRHRARLAVGRVARAYLDERGVTPVELLVSATELILVERRDPFFMNAIHVLAKAQSGATEKPAGDRAEFLFDLHETLRDRARKRDSAGAKLRKAVAAQGLAALEVPESDGPPPYEVLCCLARILSEGGSWAGRLSKMLELLEGSGGTDAARALVDEMIAEILDGAQPINEILGGLRTGSEACAKVGALATGTGSLPKYADEAAHRLHALMAKTRLPATQSVLMERVARVLSAATPLTQEGGPAERAAFTELVPTLLDPAGPLGGSPTAEALTLRSKMALGGPDELSMREAIEQLIDLFPTRAVRLGYLLDLTPTQTGRRNTDTVRRSLAYLIGQLRSVRDLMPDGTPREILLAAVHALRARLAMDSLPEEVRGALTASLDQLLQGGKPTVKPRRAAPAQRLGQREAAEGEILFAQGDEGQEAYLITEGTVDLFRGQGGREEVVATLGRGQVFGEMALFDDVPHPVAARARTGATVVTISRTDLKKRLAALEKSDPVLKLIVDSLVRRLRDRVKEKV